MFNWLIASKKNEKKIESEISSEEDSSFEQLEYEIPRPPTPDMQVALNIKHKKYPPLYYPVDFKSDLAKEYIDREIRNMRRNAIMENLKQEIEDAYQKRCNVDICKPTVKELEEECCKREIEKLHKNIHKILMNKLCNEIKEIFLENEVSDEWSSEDLSSTEEYFVKKRARQELPVFEWNTAFGNLDSPDIEMGYGSPVTEQDMERICKEIGDEWDDMPSLISEEYQENPFNQDPINIEFNFDVKDNFSNNKMKIEREKPEGYLEIFMGPMFSGKSSKVVFKLTSMADQGFKCLYINSIKDERETEVQDTTVTTHNSAYSKLSKKIDTVKVSTLSEVSVAGYDYIAVDELQFFDDDDTVRCITDWTAIYGKYVLVASLDGDCYRRKFGKVLDLVPHADEVTKLTAYCDMCRDNYRIVKKAPFTARMTSDTSAELVGGKDLYKAMCRSCHDFHLDITVNYF